MRFLTLIMAATACLAVPAGAAAQERVYDPYEGFNRSMFGVHESLDKAVFEPVARGYRAATPGFFRAGVRNFLRNLGSTVTLANDVLQGEGSRAGVTLARLGVNSTIGVLGLMDPASDMGLERHTEDFGQTLAVWGAPSGAYFFVPVLGPTNVRDAAGRVVDMAFYPLTWANYENEGAVRVTVTGLGAVSARESVIEAVEDLHQSSLDPYVSYRTTYGLFRYSAIQNGRRNIQDLPDFEAMDEFGDEADFSAPPVEETPAPEFDPEIEPKNETEFSPQASQYLTEFTLTSAGATP
jgi:phospholipid-binding lipoprotein MlaA